MNKDLLAFIASDTPPLNPDICNGLIVRDMEKCEVYLDRTIKSLLDDMGKNLGFRYLGFERISPMEEFTYRTRGKNNQSRKYDIAQSDVYMVKLKFEFKGKPYEKLLMLPFVRPAGTIFIYGTNYQVVPVLVDKIISVEYQKVFVRLTSVKLNFQKYPYQFLLNDKHVTYSIVKSSIYRNKKKTGNTRFNRYNVNDRYSLVFYILCKYGLTKMFKQFTDTEIHYGYYLDDINIHKYPKNKWFIARSYGKKPKGYNGNDYEPSNIAIAIPKEKVNTTNLNMLAGVFELLDLFSNEIDIDGLDSVEVWRVFLGKVIFGSEVNSGKLLIDINDHLSSVDNYVDYEMREELKRVGYDINDMYELFFYIIDRFEKWEEEHISSESNLYDKEYVTLDYFLGDIIKSIVKLSYDTKKNNKGKDNMSENDINNILRRLKPDVVTSIKKDHGEISVVQYSGDNMVFGLTIAAIPQNQSTKGKGAKTSPESPENHLHVSFAEVRTFNGMAKSSPVGATRINPHLKLTKHGGIIRDEELRASLDEAQELIKRP